MLKKNIDIRKTVFFCSLPKMLLCFCLFFFGWSNTAFGAETIKPSQMITLISDQTQPAVNSDFSVAVEYNTSDGNNRSTGMDVMVCFDSSKVKYIAFDEFFTTDEQSKEPFVKDDESDLDGDPSTDKYVYMSWASCVLPPAWPNKPLPLKLVSLKFQYGCGKTVIRATGRPGSNENGVDYQITANDIISINQSCKTFE